MAPLTTGAIKAIFQEISQQSVGRGRYARGGGVFSATGGTTFTPGNGYKYHVFKHPGSPKPSSYSDSFVVSGGNVNIEVLVVAGGGAGDNGYGGAGGGGGVAYNPSILVSSGTYPITIGTGGVLLPGQNSTAFGITAIGGGGGQVYNSNPRQGSTGGSAASAGSASPITGNRGIASQPTQPQPSGTINYGNNSGTSSSSDGGYQVGGGGGAGGVGSDAVSTAGNAGGNGGIGQQFPQFAAPLMPGFFPAPTVARMGATFDYYGGGGGGWGYGAGGSGNGGAGGGGGAGYQANPNEQPREGLPLTGGGGASGPERAGVPGPTDGGDGIVILRYLAT